MHDYQALDRAAAEFDMTESELYELIRAGTVQGRYIRTSQVVPAGWYVDKTSLATYRRRHADPEHAEPPDGRDFP